MSGPFIYYEIFICSVFTILLPSDSLYCKLNCVDNWPTKQQTSSCQHASVQAGRL